ncbi:MAG: hypothetical protein KUG77_30140 [Nannocystaceae bacterium]|nr:hypothetical protein [Nannocystaceae bacterium]
MTLRRQTWLMLALVALSTPMALVAETYLRGLMFPPEFDEVRAYLRPSLEVPVWSLLGLVALTTWLGIRAQTRRVERKMAARPPEEQTQFFRDKDTFDSLVLFTSLPQVPAILATFCFMFGASLVPVLVNMLAATAGVLAVGMLGLRQARIPATQPPAPGP